MSEISEISYNQIRDKIDLLKPLIHARKDISDIRNNLFDISAIQIKELNDGFNKNLNEIDVRIVEAYGINYARSLDRCTFETILFNILEGYRRVCYLDKIKW